MKRFVRITIAVGLMLSFAGAVFFLTTPAEKRLKDVERPILLYLKSHDHIIAIHPTAGESGPDRVTIATRDNTVLSEAITTQEFERLYPELHQFYRTSYADAWAGSEISAITQ